MSCTNASFPLGESHNFLALTELLRNQSTTRPGKHKAEVETSDHLENL